MKFTCRESYWPEWMGHYDKPVGKEPVFHVDVNNRIHIVQRDNYDIYLYTAEATDETDFLGNEINQCKSYYSGGRGGSFCINEFGQVIVPVMPRKDKNGKVIRWRAPRYIGYITGDIAFFNGEETVSLNAEMEMGEFWPYPYLGMRYHLSNRNKIYMEIQEGDDFRRVSLKKDYKSLIEALREIRGDGPCTFIVNPWGCILTKMMFGSDFWRPVFVGKLNYKKWFDKLSY